MELVLVRHGEPAWTSENGRTRNDPGVTERGHRQAVATARRLADGADHSAVGAVDALFVSPAIRAQETAGPIGTALGRSAETLDWLWELRNPESWDGASIEVIRAGFAALQASDREAWWDGLPGGESFLDFHARVIGGLRQLLARFGAYPTQDPALWELEAPATTARIVVVAHGGTNSVIIAHLLGIPPEPWEWQRFPMRHSGITRVATSPLSGRHHWGLHVIGDVDHVDASDRTP